jgi:hypothetical protein
MGLDGVQTETRLKSEEILGIDHVIFVEPCYSDLVDDSFTLQIIANPGDRGVLLVDENSDPLALALGDGHEWVAGSFHLRRPTAALIERFEETTGEIFQEDRETWAAAVREYYSSQIRNSVLPAVEDLNPERTRQIEELIDEYWEGRAGFRCLDCCCGSGVGSVVLRSRGLLPLSYDNDATLLSLGLHKGRLRPDETMCIDATSADTFTGHAPLGLGLMFGMIHPLNEELWESITSCLISSVEAALITVGTAEEAGLVESWVEGSGRACEVVENTRDPIYDRWVCSIEQ